MLGKELSRALGDIADEKIEAAAGIAPKDRKHIWLRVGAAAAVLALVLSWLLWPGKPDVPEDDGVVKAPGMLKVYAYDLSSGEDIEDCDSYALEEGNEATYIGKWTPSYSYKNTIGLPIRLVLDEMYDSEERVVFEVCSEHGDFYSDSKQNLGKQFSAESGDTIYWVCYEEGVKGRVIDDKAYVDITIRANDQIIGYTVVKIVRTHPDFSIFAAVLVKNVIFPMVDGKYQQITAEYVQEQMMKERGM